MGYEARALVDVKEEPLPIQRLKANRILLMPLAFFLKFDSPFFGAFDNSFHTLLIAAGLFI
jgi:hypothetical protein